MRSPGLITVPLGLFLCPSPPLGFLLVLHDIKEEKETESSTSVLKKKSAFHGGGFPEMKILLWVLAFQKCALPQAVASILDSPLSQTFFQFPLCF